MSDSEELEPPYLVGVTDDFPGGNDDDLVQWAFEAGTRWQASHSKPRTISTIEEVDALPRKAVVMTAFGDALTIYRSPRIPVEHYHFIVADGLTATVLHENEQEQP